MRISGIILLLIMFLLSGCFSGNNYSSGLLNTAELLKKKDESRMSELQRSRLLRLGIGKKQQTDVEEFKKTLESKGWRVQVVSCPEKRLTGLLRSGALDLIYFPGITEADAQRLDFYLITPSFLVKNQILYQAIR